MVIRKPVCMKQFLCFLAVVLISTTVSAQPASQDVGRGGWAPEFTARAYLSIYHGSYELTAGARVGDNVFGLGSGYGMEYWDAYPADVRKIPVYGFYRRYVPLGEKRRVLLFGDVTLGGECVYKISGTDRDGGPIEQTPYWKWRASFSPGIALRLFGNCNLFLAPTAEFIRPLDVMGGIAAGFTVGF